MLIQGKAKWAKVIGDPSWGYENKFKEWSIDVYVDKETAAKLTAEGLGAKLKDKGNGQYITFKRKETGIDKATGQVKPNKPIRVVDHKGAEWDNRKIGNGSVVNVNFQTYDYKPGQTNANILSLQVWDYVPYEGGEFPTREDSASEDAGEDWSKDAA